MTDDKPWPKLKSLVNASPLNWVMGYPPKLCHKCAVTGTCWVRLRRPMALVDRFFSEFRMYRISRFKGRVPEGLDDFLNKVRQDQRM